MADFGHQKAAPINRGAPPSDRVNKLEAKVKDLTVHLEELEKRFSESQGQIEDLKKVIEDFEVVEEVEASEEKPKQRKGGKKSKK